MNFSKSRQAPHAGHGVLGLPDINAGSEMLLFKVLHTLDFCVGAPRQHQQQPGVLPWVQIKPPLSPRQVSPHLQDEFDRRRYRFDPAELQAGFRHG